MVKPESNSFKIKKIELQIEECILEINALDPQKEYQRIGVLNRMIKSRLEAKAFLESTKELISWNKLCKKFGFSYYLY